MKWYEDLFAWVIILLVMAGVVTLSHILGVKTVVDSCENYRAYKPDKTKVVLCMVLPITEQRGIGEKEYLRPEGSKVDLLFKRT